MSAELEAVMAELRALRSEVATLRKPVPAAVRPRQMRSEPVNNDLVLPWHEWGWCSGLRGAIEPLLAQEPVYADGWAAINILARLAPRATEVFASQSAIDRDLFAMVTSYSEDTLQAAVEDGTSLALIELGKRWGTFADGATRRTKRNGPVYDVASVLSFAAAMRARFAGAKTTAGMVPDEATVLAVAPAGITARFFAHAHRGVFVVQGAVTVPPGVARVRVAEVVVTKMYGRQYQRSVLVVT